MFILVHSFVACGAGSLEFGRNGLQTEPEGTGMSQPADNDQPDADADSGPSADTGGVISDCEGADLDFSLLTLDSSGGSTQSFSYPTEVISEVRITNPCTGTVEFSTASSCLVSTWRLSGVTTAEFSGNCIEETADWSIAENDGVAVSASWGTVARGNWSVSATSAIDGRVETVYFTVQ